MKSLNKDTIQQVLIQLDQRMQTRGSREEIRILIVGGAALALRDLRDSTYDVDVFTQSMLDREFARAVLEVAQANNLPADWLNTDVTNLGFVIELMEKQLLKEYTNIKVYIATDRTLMAMKFLAYFQRFAGDADDIALLWGRGKYSLDEIEEYVYAICPGCYFDRELAESLIQDIELGVQACTW